MDSNARAYTCNQVGDNVGNSFVDIEGAEAMFQVLAKDIIFSFRVNCTFVRLITLR